MGSQVRNICTRNPRDKRPFSSMYMDITTILEARGPCECVSRGRRDRVCVLIIGTKGTSSVGLVCIASREVIGGLAGYRHGGGGYTANDGRVDCKRSHSVEGKITPLLCRRFDEAYLRPVWS